MPDDMVFNVQLAYFYGSHITQSTLVIRRVRCPLSEKVAQGLVAASFLSLYLSSPLKPARCHIMTVNKMCYIIDILTSCIYLLHLHHIQIM